jgi:hypothetical protein
MPGWMHTIDDFTVVKAGGAGFANAVIRAVLILLIGIKLVGHPLSGFSG